MFFTNADQSSSMTLRTSLSRRMRDLLISMTGAVNQAAYPVPIHHALPLARKHSPLRTVRPSRPTNRSRKCLRSRLWV